jgi:hypothetical protein
MSEDTEQLGPGEEWEFYDEDPSTKTSTAPQSQEETDQERGYSELAWKNFPLFQCLSCKFNHVSPNRDEENIKAHVWKFHQMAENLAMNAALENKTRPLEAELYDPSGKLIVERDATSEERAEDSFIEFEPPKTLNG